MDKNSSFPDNRWLILGVMSLSLIIVMLNNVTLNVALPELSKDLKADNSQLQWILDSYALVFGGTLLVMGALGDRYGRKGALQIGLVTVAGASAWTALFAETAEQVIAARAVMGLGAALVMPSTLSVVLVVFPSHERGKAIGIWAAMAGVGAPIGLLVGGWAVENFDWQMVFLINVPIIIFALIAGAILVPKSRDESQMPLDWTGAL
ncbi:MAG: MFS transporter, partial [Euryarchaeota archaeon]|nr:MFS transporter [Euryarchaeota archaeon]